MGERRYLLNIGQMLEDGRGDALFREAIHRIDSERRRKASLINNTRAQAASIGAGLLIQKVLIDARAEHPSGQETGCPSGQEAECLLEPRMEQGVGLQGQPEVFVGTEQAVMECYSVEELLADLGRNVIEPCYQYGKNGKPYLADVPFQFNISHSGDYVFCGVSKQEIGVDIQRIQGNSEMRLARRFFPAEEYRMLEECADVEVRRRMFFRMWVRKEAYGKFTGEGIAGAVGQCLWRDVTGGEELSVSDLPKESHWEDDSLVWEEYGAPEGYRMAVCRRRGNILKNTKACVFDSDQGSRCME